jgi:hypothetical protein
MENLMRIGGTAVLRNPDLSALETPQLKRFAPTIFAKRAIEGVSDNYGHVRTFEIIETMREHGYDCVEVRQSQRRDETRMPFTKHMLKFRKQGQIKGLLKRGDVIPQVVMLNSHDRSSGFHLYAGMFRVVCENGLIVADGQFVEPLKVRHSLSMVQDIVEKAGLLIKGADGVYSIREEMLRVQLTEREAKHFAVQALEHRPPRRAGVLEPATLLTPRRPEDKSNDLWHTFNRVQENMMKGGAATVTEGGRNVNTKGIGRIERDVQVNSALWTLAVDTLNKKGKGTKATKSSAAKKASVEEILA